MAKVTGVVIWILNQARCNLSTCTCLSETMTLWHHDTGGVSLCLCLVCQAFPPPLPVVWMGSTQCVTTTVPWKIPSMHDWCSLSDELKITFSEHARARYSHVTWTNGIFTCSHVTAPPRLWLPRILSLPSGRVSCQTGRQVPAHSERIAETLLVSTICVVLSVLFSVCLWIQ